VKVSDLPQQLATHAAFVHAGRLYVVGGIEGRRAPRRRRVCAARVRRRRRARAWEDGPALPEARGHCHQAPVVGGRVFLAGGAVSHASKGTTFVGTLE